MTHKVWTVDEVRALGVRTDLRTACDVLGFGYTTGKAEARNGTFPVPVLRLANKYVVPVAPILRLLEVPSVVDADEPEAAERPPLRAVGE